MPKTIETQKTEFVTSTSYQNAALIITEKLDKSTFQIKNDHASIDMTYKIYGSMDNTADPNTLTNDEWVNLISISDGGTYNHDAESALAATIRKIETLTDFYYSVVIQVKAASGTPTVKIWHGGSG